MLPQVLNFWICLFLGLPDKSAQSPGKLLLSQDGRGGGGTETRLWFLICPRKGTRPSSHLSDRRDVPPPHPTSQVSN